MLGRGPLCIGDAAGNEKGLEFWETAVYMSETQIVSKNAMKLLAKLAVLLGLALCLQAQARDWVVYEGKEGAGKGKHIVFISGDEEYRSEEGLPMMAKILSQRHGFKCTVLFAVNPKDGTIDPNEHVNIPGLEALQTADMMVMLLRFREPADDQMKYIADFVNSGKPIMGLRTSTHAFDFAKNKGSAYAKYSWTSKEWPGGFGQHVLGDTWISHHGNHGSESTRAIINKQFANHPVLTDVDDVWGPTDVYGIVHLPADTTILAHGSVLAGMKPDAKPVDGPKNNPMMPLIWVRGYQGESGKTSRVICTTMGAATDLESAGLRRLLVNACYWGMGMKVPHNADVNYVGEFKPTPFGFGRFQKGIKPSDHELKP